MWELHRESFEASGQETGESSADFDRLVDGQVRRARTTYQKERALKELAGYDVDWDQISPQEVLALEKLVAQNPQEAQMQTFLEENPKFLIQALTGGHGRYQIAKPRLGAEFIPDFMVAEMDSMGIHWFAVELESPRKKAVRGDGSPRREVHQALAQVQDWRSWLSRNLEYARKRRDEHGLGLIGIDATVPGLILIGRREEYPEHYNEFRRSQLDRQRIEIHSYDWLVDVARSNSSRQLQLYAKTSYLHGRT
ncbi:MAG: DUF4263 domain-containing protein [Chloroflexi bacterium]|nr:DUF4263 domain-containing protein [Chloroflexota bacterium]